MSQQASFSTTYAWEFGAGLGHMGIFLPLGERLREAGHQVNWIVAHPTDAARLLASRSFTWLQAPQTGEMRREGSPLSYADILLRFGYTRPDDLYGLVVAWRELFRLTGTQLVLADHAPTALLAARTLGLPVMLFSNGFTAPPRISPLPNLRYWLDIPPATISEIDAAAHRSINAVLERFGQPPLARTADLFDVAEEALITFPELDHYPDRGPATYWGSIPSAGTGRPSEWPPGGRAKIFAYLRPECVHHEALLTALMQLGQPTLIYFADMPPGLRERYTVPHLRFLDGPADIDQMTREADLGITYASLATTTAFLLAGKPLLLLPWHLEQFMLARRVVDMGAGQLVNPEQPPGDLRSVIAELVNNPAWRENARGFATKYAAFDQEAVLGNVVRRIGELLGGGGIKEEELS